MFLQKIPTLKDSFYSGFFIYFLKIFIAFSGAVLFPLIFNHGVLVVSPILGVVAAGLADIDDTISGRLKNLLVTLLCFFIASVSVELLFPYPILFSFGLVISTASFILLGALGQRYATIAFTTLLIALYTMLNYSPDNLWYSQPLWLLLGVLWYNILSLLFDFFWPFRPLQEKLSSCFFQLSLYLDAKSAFFDPDEEDDFTQQKLNLTMVNANLANALDEVQLSLMRRLKRDDRGQKNTRSLSADYFIVQEIYERAASSHVDYQHLSRVFKHSDILFRFQRLLMQQSLVCQQISELLLRQQNYSHSPSFLKSFTHLRNTLDLLKAQFPQRITLIESMNGLSKNLKAIDLLLASYDRKREKILEPQPKKIFVFTDTEKIGGIKGAYQRIKQNLTRDSALFRHAVRMSIVLFVSYLLVQAVEILWLYFVDSSNEIIAPYWIMLTSAFVCQPNYSATKTRLIKRFWGTIVGVICTIILLKMGLSENGQLLLITVGGTLFFCFRRASYGYATAFITLMVLLCFNLLQEGFVGPERILDTVIGCVLAWLAVTFIWPDWQFRKIDVVANKMVEMDCHYLKMIGQQYHDGKVDDMDYFLARDNANAADAEMSSLVSSLLAEPNPNQVELDKLFRLMCLNNTFLGYISALGAHRICIHSDNTLSLLDRSIGYIVSSFQAEVLSSDVMAFQLILQSKLENITPYIQMEEKILLQQLNLIFEVLPEFIQRLEEIK